MLLSILTTVLHLLEVEGRILKRAVMNVVWSLACIGVASLLVLASAGFFLVGIYQFLAAQIPPPVASLLVSLLAFGLAFIFANIAKWLTADPK
jgi:hypothetical protein